jgi:hypothetical protein
MSQRNTQTSERDECTQRQIADIQTSQLTDMQIIQPKSYTYEQNVTESMYKRRVMFY